jgi:hypothetical protein
MTTAGGERRATTDILARVSDLGAAAQASIPGLYAWAVTVAPAAWSKGGTLGAKLLALLGVVALGAGLVLERRSADAARWSRPLSVWGLAIPSALVWLSSSSAMTPLRLDTMRGLAGMLGWALFAFASAAPAIKRSEDANARIVEGAALRPRTRIPKGDVAFMAVGFAIACILQAIGWRATPPERAVLVRLVTLAAGLAVMGGATTIALARHSRRIPAPRRERVRAGFPWVALLSVLLIAGALFYFVLSR